MEPGETKWTMKLVGSKGENPSKGDVFLEEDGKLRVYDGAAWIDAGGGASEEYVNSKVQEEAAAREGADDEIRKSIPTKISQFQNDSGFITQTGTVDHAMHANTANSVPWDGITGKQTASTTDLGLVKAGKNLTIDADGTLNASGGGSDGHTIQVFVHNTNGVAG